MEKVGISATACSLLFKDDSYCYCLQKHFLLEFVCVKDKMMSVS